MSFKKSSKCPNCQQLIYVKSCTVDSNGEHHSFNDKPAIITSNGVKKWYNHGVKHRSGDKPAQVSKSINCWYKDGKMHRLGAPAQIRIDPKTKKIITTDWYWEGVQAIRIHTNKNQVSRLWHDGKKSFMYNMRKGSFSIIIIERYEWNNQEAFLCLVNGIKKTYFMGGYWKSQG